jgi:hypothetical protein
MGGGLERRKDASRVRRREWWVRGSKPLELTPTVRKPLGYMAPETTFHHASVFPVTSSLWETVGGSPATLRRPLSPPPKGQKSRGPAWRLDATAITKLHRGNSSLSCSIQHFGIQSKSPGSACASSREALLAGMMPAERRLGPRLWKRNPGVEGAECQTAQCLTQFFSARPAKTRPARPDSTTESIRHDAPPPDLSFRFSGSMSRGAVRRCGRWLRSVRPRSGPLAVHGPRHHFAPQSLSRCDKSNRHRWLS